MVRVAFEVVHYCGVARGFVGGILARWCRVRYRRKKNRRVIKVSLCMAGGEAR